MLLGSSDELLNAVSGVSDRTTDVRAGWGGRNSFTVAVGRLKSRRGPDFI